MNNPIKPLQFGPDSGFWANAKSQLGSFFGYNVQNLNTLYLNGENQGITKEDIQRYCNNPNCFDENELVKKHLMDSFLTNLNYIYHFNDQQAEQFFLQLFLETEDPDTAYAVASNLNEGQVDRTFSLFQNKAISSLFINNPNFRNTFFSPSNKKIIFEILYCNSPYTTIKFFSQNPKMMEFFSFSPVHQAFFEKILKQAYPNRLLDFLSQNPKMMELFSSSPAYQAFFEKILKYTDDYPEIIFNLLSKNAGMIDFFSLHKKGPDLLDRILRYSKPQAIIEKIIINPKSDFSIIEQQIESELKKPNNYEDIEHNIAYLRSQSPFNKTRPDAISHLGSGSANITYKVTFTIDNQPTVMVFKPVTSETFSSDLTCCMATGIQYSGVSARNMATTRLNQYLKFDVIVETHLATLEVPSSKTHRNGILMAFAKGTPAHIEKITQSKFNDSIGTDFEKKIYGYFNFLLKQGMNSQKALELCRAHLGSMELKFENGNLIRKDVEWKFPQAKHIFQDPFVRKKLNQLQFIDSIAGQVDRHYGNYHIYLENNVCVGLKGFDNEASWGYRLQNLSQIGNIQYAIAAVYLVGLPLVADQETFDAITKMTKEDLIQICAELLLPSELQAAKARLQQVQNHLYTLQQQGRIIDKGVEAWLDGKTTPSGESITALISDPTTSYIGREIVITAKAIEQHIPPYSCNYLFKRPIITPEQKRKIEEQ